VAQLQNTNGNPPRERRFSENTAPCFLFVRSTTNQPFEAEVHLNST
jgi:hypothetical protein